MVGEQSVIIISLQVIAGIFLAAGLLFYIKRFDEKTRLTFSALALFIAAVIYVLFALVSNNPLFIALEIVGLAFFMLMIWLGYKYSFWFVVLGWLLHVLWDLGLQPGETVPYVPQWYTWLCLGFDLVIALYLAVVLVKSDEIKSSVS